MKFPHHVRHNGIDYPIGTDVPIEVETPAVKAGASVSGKVKKEVKEDKAVIKEEEPKGRKYSEEDLDVPYFSLKALAKKEGLKIPDKAKAGEIKDMLRAL